MTITMIFRCIAWLFVCAIAIVTLSPIELRPVTAAPADLERFAAFVAIGAAFCLGYPKHRLTIVLVVIGIAGLLEVLQHVVPGRHGQVHDYVMKAIGVMVGAVAASTAERIFGRIPSSLPARDVQTASK
jgi:hypothetical protein